MNLAYKLLILDTTQNTYEGFLDALPVRLWIINERRDGCGPYVVFTHKPLAEALRDAINKAVEKDGTSYRAEIWQCWYDPWETPLPRYLGSEVALWRYCHITQSQDGHLWLIPASNTATMWFKAYLPSAACLARRIIPIQLVTP